MKNKSLFELIIIGDCNYVIFKRFTYDIENHLYLVENASYTVYGIQHHFVDFQAWAYSLVCLVCVTTPKVLLLLKRSGLGLSHLQNVCRTGTARCWVHHGST